MPVHNGGQFLTTSVGSILRQSFGDFEFIIVNDGSTDDTREILNRFASMDSRILILENAQQIGLSQSLNRALEAARGEFIARMDADDESISHRLWLQVRYLESHPEVGVLGTAVEISDSESGTVATRVYPTSPSIVKWRMCFENPIAHPSTMIRRRLLVETGGYNSGLNTSQDYDLWCRLSSRARLTNLPDVLLVRACHDKNVTYVRRDEQYSNAILTSQKFLADLLDQPVSIEAVKLMRVRNFDDLQIEDTMIVAELGYHLCRAILMEETWSFEERQALRMHAARRIFELLRPHTSHPRSYRILQWVTLLDPIFIILSAMGKLSRTFRSLFRSAT